MKERYLLAVCAIFILLVVLVMVIELCWILQQVLQTVAFGGVFFGRERTALFGDDAGDHAVAAFDLIAELQTSAAPIEHVKAKVGEIVLDHGELIDDGGGHPLLRRAGELTPPP